MNIEVQIRNINPSRYDRSENIEVMAFFGALTAAGVAASVGLLYDGIRK